MTKTTTTEYLRSTKISESCVFAFSVKISFDCCGCVYRRLDGPDRIESQSKYSLFNFITEKMCVVIRSFWHCFFFFFFPFRFCFLLSPRRNRPLVTHFWWSASLRVRWLNDRSIKQNAKINLFLWCLRFVWANSIVPNCGSECVNGSVGMENFSLINLLLFPHRRVRANEFEWNAPKCRSSRHLDAFRARVRGWDAPERCQIRNDN